jgi:hypothetical protein
VKKDMIQRFGSGLGGFDEDFEVGFERFLAGELVKALWSEQAVNALIICLLPARDLALGEVSIVHRSNYTPFPHRVHCLRNFSLIVQLFFDSGDF